MKPAILIVDDNLVNRYVLESLFGAEGFRPITANNGREALELARLQPPALIISDILMPVMDGYQLCRELKADPATQGIPFVFYTATYTEHKDEVFALGLGAELFLLKPADPDVLLQAVHGLLGTGHRSTPQIHDQAEFDHLHSEVLFRKLEKKVGELERLNQTLLDEILLKKAVEQRNQVLISAFENSPLALAIAAPDGTIEYANRLFVGGQPPGPLNLSELPAGSDFFRVERHRHGPAGQWLLESHQYFRVRDAHGQTTNLILMVEDITDRKVLEERVLRGEKMEELGLMVGGVAHDFNNILSGIFGLCDMVLLRLEDGDQTVDQVLEIKEAAHRGSRLTQQLLSVSRQRQTGMERLELSTLIQDFSGFLKLLLPANIAFVTESAGQAIWVHGDHGQIEQAVMNLVINARDAMPDGGRLKLSTGIQLTDAGPMAVLVVEDNGTGMTPDIQEHILEPFFTTKEAGRGTGLGLALVAGVVEKHIGRLEIDSQPGRGSRFQIYLPLAAAEPS